MLQLDNVTKVYKVGTFGSSSLYAVSDVTFDVQEGEVMALIGESGSGKSTIGKMILRLIPITSGSITYNGVDINGFKGEHLKEYFRTVQGVFQDPFSSYNPIFKADRIFSIIKDEFFPNISQHEWDNRVAVSLKGVGLNPEHVLNKFPHQLSGGQLQRFLIARALLLNVKFLVADEIISMLDASTRIDVLNLLADLKKRGLSILFITHDLSLAYYISERAVILRSGCVVEMGATEKLFNNPMHPYTRSLMASVPRLDKKWAEEEQELASHPPALGNGYEFYEHYPVAGRGQAVTHPRLLEVESDHFVAVTES
jgi:peptide/nickel transport system ATP-binding protein